VRAGRIALRVTYRPPLAAGPLGRALRAHAVPGLERHDDDGRIARVMRAPGGPALVRVALGRGDGEMRAELRPARPEDVAHLLLGLRRWLGLDADPSRIDPALAADPELAPLVAARPGLRVPGAADPFEAAVLVVLGQQVSLAAARTVAGRLMAAHGTPVADGLAAFPTPLEVALAEPGRLRAALGVPAARARTVQALAEALAAGDLRLGAGADPAAARAALRAIPGVGDWTVECIALRALGDADAFPAGDLVLRRALGGADARAALARAERWRPWRAHALMHLWTREAFPDPPSRDAAPGRWIGGRPVASASDGRIPS
jgi:DNA-3-methyladenine glycosylase II